MYPFINISNKESPGQRKAIQKLNFKHRKNENNGEKNLDNNYEYLKNTSIKYLFRFILCFHKGSHIKKSFLSGQAT